MSVTKKGEDVYCHLTWIENGKVWPRRIREMTFQWRGQFYRLVGDDLPEAAVIQTGESHTGYGIADFLLRSDRPKPEPVEEGRDRGFVWPVRRDVFHVAVGFAGLQLLRATFLAVDAFASELFYAFQDAVMK